MIIGHLVVKNEAENFLDSCLAWNSQWWDVLHVYDDRSTDNTVDIAFKHTKHVTIRSEDSPSFFPNESKFRENAWNDMIEKVQPNFQQDWVFCFDADEFLVGSLKQPNPKDFLFQYIQAADHTRKDSVEMPRQEIWDISGKPLKRVDGEWGRQQDIRFVRLMEGPNKFKERNLGCGSLPAYGYKNILTVMSLCGIYHYGYSIPGRAAMKQEMYSVSQKNAHSRKHVDSLTQKPKLEECIGAIPKVWLGEK